VLLINPPELPTSQPPDEVAVIINQLGEFVPASRVILPLCVVDISFKLISELDNFKFSIGETVAVTFNHVNEPLALFHSLLILALVVPKPQLSVIIFIVPISAANKFAVLVNRIPTMEIKAITFFVFVFIFFC
jgi:hypothetical protein